MKLSPRTITFVACLAVGASALPTTASAATRKVPQGFAGVAMDPWQLGRDGLDVEKEISRAASAGVESIRFPVYWFDVRPYAGGGYDWSVVDAFFASASKHGMALMPQLMGAPRWAADTRYPLPGSPGSELMITIPRDPAEFAAFASDAVNRYRPASKFKPAGSFWNSRPDLTPTRIQAWQVWNEPNYRKFWPQHEGERQTVTIGSRKYTSTEYRFVPTYLALLRPTSRAIKAADPTAKVMLGSMTNLAWDAFTRLYSAGGKGLGKSGLFDIAGLNTFTSSPANLISMASRIRAILRSNLDGAVPIAFTEYSWSASKGVAFPASKVDFLSVSSSTQATNLGVAFDRFVASRTRYGIMATYWYSWATPYRGTDSLWDYSGLRTYATGTPKDKPALATFQRKALAAEGCRWKVHAASCASAPPPSP